jgi:putative transcriptional regulator
MTPDPKAIELSSIAALVYELRQRVGLSQEKFAAKLGVTFSTVSRWERQKAMPSPMAFDRMRELLEKMGDRGTDLLEEYFPNED